jgi:FtsZ-binding cell division protein ZapB|tara:strand:- start:887 stop:1333 length:447 start_codon:yes stop_codon:yes gene_type:complete
MFKYLASIPVVLSLLAGAYGGINYINKLNNTIDDNEDAIALLQLEIDNMYNSFGDEIDNVHQIYSERTSRNSNNYTEAREELVREMTDMVTWVGRIEAKLQAIEKLLYETASDAGLRALEDQVRTNADSIRQFKYDMKDLENTISGGY